MEENIKYYVHGLGNEMYIVATYSYAGQEKPLVDTRDHDEIIKGKLLSIADCYTKQGKLIESALYIIRRYKAHIVAQYFEEELKYRGFHGK